MVAKEPSTGDADPQRCEQQGDHDQELSRGSLRVHDAHKPNSQTSVLHLRKFTRVPTGIRRHADNQGPLKGPLSHHRKMKVCSQWCQFHSYDPKPISITFLTNSHLPSPQNSQKDRSRRVLF